MWLWLISATLLWNADVGVASPALFEQFSHALIVVVVSSSSAVVVVVVVVAV